MQASVLEQTEQEKIDQAIRSMNSALSELDKKQKFLSLNLDAQFNLSRLQKDVIDRVESDLRAHEDQIISLAIAGNIEDAQAIALFYNFIKFQKNGLNKRFCLVFVIKLIGQNH